MDFESAKVKRAALIQLLFSFYIQRGIFSKSAFPAPSVLPEAVFSRAGVLFENIEICAGSSFVALLVVQLLKVDSGNTVSVFAIVASFIIAAALNLCYVHCHSLYALGLLLFASSPKAIRIIAASTWLWAGLHKINPSFLIQHTPSVDNVLFLVVGKAFVQKHTVLLHLFVALTESGAGMILLLSLWKKINTKIIRFIQFYLVVLHLVIIFQFMKWDTRTYVFIMIAWNINCLYMAILLWPCFSQFDTDLTVSVKERSPQPSASIVGALLMFTIIPSLFMFTGQLDVAFAYALHTNNFPNLEIELPVTESLLKELENLGISDAFHSPFRTHDDRFVAQADGLELMSYGTNLGGYYISEWAFKKASSQLCRLLDKSLSEDQAQVLNDARSYLRRPYVGSTLFESLATLAGVLIPDHLLLPPPTFVKFGCKSSEWEEFKEPLQPREIYGLNMRPQHHRAVFELPSNETCSEDKEEHPVDIYWVKSVGNELDTVIKYQGTLRKCRDTVRIKTSIGHRFVAVRKDADTDDFCVLEVFGLSRTEGTIEQNLQLESTLWNAKGRTIQGMKACPPPPGL